jgi:diguanylate cyclase (GGDEF)-like protein
MLQRARYVALALVALLLFVVARTDLNNMRALTADTSFYTSQLSEVTRLEKEILQFRADANALVLGHGKVTQSDVRLSFEVVWTRFNTKWTRYISPRIEAVRNYSRDMQDLWAALQTIQPDVYALRPGDFGGLKRINDVMQRFEPAMMTMNKAAYAEMIRRSASVAQMQRNVTRGIDRFQWLFMIVCITGLTILLMQLRRSEKLYADLLKRESEIRILASVDALTGLNNRRHFDEQMRAIDGGLWPGEVQLLLIDLDGFKQVNDMHGHEAGDQVLREIAARIRSAAGDAAVVARLGGDEFAVITSALIDRARDIASTIISTVQVPVKHAGKTLMVSASIGISSSERGPKHSVTMLREADRALYEAKNNGRNCYVIFDNMTAARQGSKSAA